MARGPSAKDASLVKGKEGHWVPAPGYVWVNKDDPKDLRVEWKPGIEHTKYRNVVASEPAGTGRAAEGCNGADPDTEEASPARKKRDRPAVRRGGKSSTKAAPVTYLSCRATWDNGLPARNITFYLWGPYSEMITTD